MPMMSSVHDLVDDGIPLQLNRSRTHLEAIKPKLKEILKAAKMLNSDSQSSDILSGEIDLGLFWNGEVVGTT